MLTRTPTSTLPLLLGTPFHRQFRHEYDLIAGTFAGALIHPLHRQSNAPSAQLLHPSLPTPTATTTVSHASIQPAERATRTVYGHAVNPVSNELWTFSTEIETQHFDTAECNTADVQAPVTEPLPDELRDFSDVVHNDPLNDMPPERPIEHANHLKPGSAPVAQPYRRLSPRDADELHKQLAAYTSAGVLVPSTSQYASPVLFVSKADGSRRMCIDYRALNSITVID